MNPKAHWLWPSLLMLTQASVATPFDECPSEAFLIQDSVARIYGVNLATGYYEELSNDMATSNKINALGYNTYDDHLYGWGYEFGTVVKIGRELNATPISLSNTPNTNFYVGDVSLDENAYYFYKRGSQYGLYKVSLDEQSNDYAQVNKIANGNTLSVNIYDFAFHPTNSKLYSVDSRGDLFTIDPTTGSATNLGNVGESGTFGAVYFDSQQNFYISRNSDGNIFRINVNDENPSAEFFAFGPSSSNNDGARCALADIISEDSSVDFGDAPESYSTSIESNGARHEITDDLYLGEQVGGEDDGVNFVTGFETGLDTMVQVNSTGEGVLNAWVDWDQNGQFEEDEIAIENHDMSDSENRILVDVPIDAKEGNTWSRFRLSSQGDIGPTGGVSDGEVEDHPITVSESGLRIETYPSSGNFVTLAFEDNWPLQGDYDMNDVVVALQTQRYIDENEQVHRYSIEGKLLSLGASYRNGFAIQLDGIETANIDSTFVRYDFNGNGQDTNPLEENADSDDAVLIINQDLWQEVASEENCSYYRTEYYCDNDQQINFSVSVPLISSVPESQAPSGVLNPFIFATPGTYHGDVFAQQPGRSLEIHLKNKNVSARFDTSFFGLADDNSDNANDLRFLTNNNMPWALEIPTLWSHPVERIDLLDAYPEFSGFVESSGSENGTWYMLEKADSALIKVNN